MHKFKTYLLIFTISGLLFYPRSISGTCGGGGDYMYYYNFMQPEMADPEASYKALHFTYSTLLTDYEWDTQAYRQKENLESWKVYFNQAKIGTVDIDRILMKSSPQEMQEISAYVKGNGKLRNDSLANNPLVVYLRTLPNYEVIDYFSFAKSCEPLVTTFSDWTQPSQDEEMVNKLIKDAKIAESSLKDPFLKARYIYQIIRMTHYQQGPRRTLTECSIYSGNIGRILTLNQEHHFLYYWILGHYAGALKMLGNEADAAYQFALVFDHCPSKRIPSYYSFEITSDENFSRALALCKNNREKTSIYFLRALKPYSQVTEELPLMYALDPDSDQIRFLLMREINRLESDLLSTELKDNLLFFENPQSFPKKENMQQLQNLQTFINQVIQEKKVKNILFWQMASAYLNFMSGEKSLANQQLSLLKSQSKDSLQLKNITLLQLAIQIQSLQKMDAQAENELYTQVKALDNQYLRDFYFRNASRLYQLQGQKGKAYLSSQTYWDFYRRADMPIVDDLIAFKNQDNKTAFEKELDSYLMNINQLLEIKATLYLRNDQLEEAIALFGKLPKDQLSTLPYNPFVLETKDCYYNNGNCPKGDETKLSLAQKLVDLKSKTASNDKIALEALFKLGNAYYNMTWFGNSWEAAYFDRSTSDINIMGYYKEGQKEIYQNMVSFADCSKAQNYFQKAYELAVKLKDKESAAKALFMAAKCEQNQYYISDGYQWNGPIIFHAYRKNFELLKKDFSKTKYYKEAIKECSYFNTFAQVK